VGKAKFAMVEKESEEKEIDAEAAATPEDSRAGDI
jgi:hypothetical protein